MRSPCTPSRRKGVETEGWGFPVSSPPCRPVTSSPSKPLTTSPSFLCVATLRLGVAITSGNITSHKPRKSGDRKSVRKCAFSFGAQQSRQGLLWKLMASWLLWHRAKPQKYPWTRTSSVHKAYSDPKHFTDVAWEDELHCVCKPCSFGLREAEY